MEIDYINGPKTDRIFGMFRYQNEIKKRINSVHFNLIEYDSFTRSLEIKYKSLFPVKTNISTTNKSSLKDELLNGLVNTGKDISNRIDRYRYLNLVKNEIKEDNIKHITYQDLAYLLNHIKPLKTVINCYDLIPWVYDKNRSSLWKNNIEGLKRANRIITISKFSKDEIIKYLNYPAQKIEIIYPAVDHNTFKILDGNKIKEKLDVVDNQRIVLYVGSEDPRQNLDILMKAFKKLKQIFPQVILIKIGNPHLYGARKKLLKQIEDLGIKNDVIFLDFVPENELPSWYNAADLLVYPCSYAGFGLPPLEAMACGTPVITSNTSSLPEVVGDAGVTINPRNADSLCNEMYRILTDEGLMDEMSKTGLKRSKLFNWDESAKKTLEVYQKMY